MQHAEVLIRTMLQQLYSDTQAGIWRFYCDTKIIACRSIPDAKAKLDFIARATQSSKILLLTDDNIRQLEFYRALFSNMSVDEIVLGPECEESPIDEAVRQGREMHADAIVAIGGGSVLDAAKLVAAAVPNKIRARELLQYQVLPVRPLSLIAIPTTFGTGSESNMITHLLTPERKLSMKREWLSPAFALLIGEIAQRVPEQLRYLCALDAWVHAIEVFMLKRETSPIQQALVETALAIHKKSFRRYVLEPDIEAASDMAAASTMAGVALNNARTGLIHALATPFAAKFRLPHAESLLPFIETSIKYNWEGIKHKLEDTELVDYLDFLREQYLFNAASTMKTWQVDVTSSDIDDMADACMQDTVLLKENPVSLDNGAYAQLYRHSLVSWLN